MNSLNEQSLKVLFEDARSQNGWQAVDVSDDLLKRLYHLTSLGPTSANCLPARFVFVRSEEGKKRLMPCLSKGNFEKTLGAPVSVLIAFDREFYERLPMLFPHGDARSWFTTSPGLAAETAMRNSSMQAAYFIMAARALGLDTGPMSGFDTERINAEFFGSSSWSINLIVNIGYGLPDKVFDRLPRLLFNEACTIL